MTKEMLSDKLKKHLITINPSERPVYEPGEYINKTLIAGAYSGGGGMKIHQEGLLSLFDDKISLSQLAGAGEKYVINAELRQWCWILERLKKDLLPENDPAKKNKNGPYVRDTLDPAIDDFKKALYKTKGIHNTKELRALCEAPAVKLCSVKIARIDAGGAVHPDTRRIFKNEHILLSELPDSNIPNFLAPYGETDRGIYQVTRFIDGQDLLKVISPSETSWRKKGETHLPPEAVIAIMLQIAMKKMYMQEKISSEKYDELGMDTDDNTSNYRLEYIGRLNLVDQFCGKTEGTIQHFASERVKANKAIPTGGFEGKYSHNPKSCVFEAIGIPSYTLMTNQHPFEGKGVLLLERIVNGSYEPVTKLNNAYSKHEIEIMVGKPLTPNPDKRPSIEDTAYDLRKIFEERVGKRTEPHHVVRELITKHMEQERDSKYTQRHEEKVEESSSLMDDAKD